MQNYAWRTREAIHEAVRQLPWDAQFHVLEQNPALAQQNTEPARRGSHPKSCLFLTALMHPRKQSVCLRLATYLFTAPPPARSSLTSTQCQAQPSNSVALLSLPAEPEENDGFDSTSILQIEAGVKELLSRANWARLSASLADLCAILQLFAPSRICQVPSNSAPSGHHGWLEDQRGFERGAHSFVSPS